jgi:hypothetical protein
MPAKLINIIIFIGDVKMKQSGFLNPGRSETQMPAVKCNYLLWFSRQNLIRVKQFLNWKIFAKSLKNLA